MPERRIAIRRAITLTASPPGTITGWLEDNFHHFGVMVGYERGKVTDVRATTVRYPWTTCAEAGQPLAALVGELLDISASRLAARLPLKLQCTHLFELAVLAAAHAARGGADRRDDITVYEGGSQRGQFHATLVRDERELLSLDVTGHLITGPEEVAGRDLYAGFGAWLGSLGTEEAERMWLMRRAFWLAAGRNRFTPSPIADGVGLAAVCHSFQPGQRFRAHAMAASRIDVTDPAMRLLAGPQPVP